MRAQSTLLPFVWMMACLLLTGCVAAPVEEAKIFTAGAIAVQTGSGVLFDKLAEAERSQMLLEVRSKAGRAPSFAVRDAYYYSTTGEPPLTNEFRKALDVVVNYAKLLENLINGTNNDSQKALLLQIASDLSALTATPGVVVAAGALSPIIDQALLARSRSEAKSLALRGAPAVSKLIAALRNATPQMFNLLVPTIVRADGASSKQFGEYQTVLGDYVVLLDHLEQNFKHLIAAYQRPSDASLLVSIAESTGAINADVKGLRRALAAIK